MFYAHAVLSKTGPFAKIWLAAHWDKKLTKAHVFETNLETTVKDIMAQKVQMALRTSGHLLLGVVRIHSRKAKYLLSDCNEAFVKIKMAFRPGVVDLPEDSREAAITAITLPEVFHDFDAAVPDFNDFELNRGRFEDITIKEDFGTITLPGHDDGFGGDMQLVEIDHEGDFYKQSTDFEMENKKKDLTIDASIDKPMEIATFDKPADDDGFGEIQNILGDGDGFGVGIIDEGNNLFEEQPEITEKEPGLPELEAAKGPEDGELQSVKNGEDKDPTQTPAHQTLLVPDENEAFALEPIDVTGAKEAARTRRKRKLIVDEIKELSGDIIKAQLKDTSDIVTTLDLAPPTKKLMLWKETGGVEKLFACSARLVGSFILNKMFTRNLTNEIPSESKKPRLETERYDGSMTSSSIIKEKDVSMKQDESILQLQPDKIASNDVDSISDNNMAIADDDIGFEGIEANDDSLSESDNELDRSDDVEDKDASQSMSQTQTTETAEEMLEKKWNKRSLQMLQALHKQLLKADTVSFKDIYKKFNRKQAASRFYTCLVLKKNQAISVEQAQPFGDITISKGPKFAESGISA